MKWILAAALHVFTLLGVMKFEKEEKGKRQKKKTEKNRGKHLSCCSVLLVSPNISGASC